MSLKARDGSNPSFGTKSMNILFVTVSAIYITALAVIDALVNRLIFRENHKLSYFSPTKKAIYKRPEWTLYCFLFLIILPIFIPILVSYSMGGIKFVITYIFIFAVVDWDVIFGKIVFNDWFGDLPSICLPKIGWIHFKLWPTIIIRVVIAIFCLFLLV